MGLNTQPAFDVHTDDAKNGSIPDLISYLKSAFRLPDFEEVKRILVCREEKMKEEYEILEKKNGDLAMEKLEAEDYIKAYKNARDELTEQVRKLREDKRVIGERERRVEGRYRKLLEEVKKKEESEKERWAELQSRNRELECGKRKAEAEIEVWKKRFGELESRVLRLEEDSAVLMRGESLFLKKVIKEEVVEANVGFDEGMGEKGRTEAGKFQNEKGAGSGNASFNPTRIEENGSNFNEKINGLAAGGSMSHPRTEETRGLRDEGPYSIGMVHAMEVKENDPSGCEKKYKKPERKKLMAEAVSPSNRMVSSMPSGGRHASGQFIEISDSDDETPTGKTGLLASKLKRKRESSTNVSGSENDDAYNPISGKRKMKQLKELIHEPRGLPGDYCSAASAASGGKIVDKSITPSRQNSEVLRRCEDKTGSKQNSDCHVSGSFLKVLDGCDSDDGSTDSTTDSEDDRFLSQFG